MKATIIIPNYNGSKYINNCLKSILNQGYNFYEIIIVDNASTDDSCKIITENYPNVNLISLSENFGFSKAVNVGIKASSSQYVVLLNNDTEVHENWLENLINCIETDEKIFSCSSKMIRYFDREKIDDAGDEYNILGWAYKIGDGLSKDRFTTNREIFSSCAGAAIYRSKIFKKIGYFDESFFAYLEDVDISYRAKIFGYKNVYCSNALVYHVGCASSGSKYNNFKARLIGRNNIYVIYKNMPILQIIINSPFILCGLIIKTFFYYKKRLGKEYIGGINQACKNLKEIHKMKYSNTYLINYIKIEFEMIINTFKYFYAKF